MSGILWRLLIAVLCVVLAVALIPPVSRILGIPIDGDVLLVVRICIAGLAAFYVLRGRSVPPA